MQKDKISACKTAKFYIKKCGPIYYKQCEKSCGTQGGGQEMAVIVDWRGKVNNYNPSEFGVKSLVPVVHNSYAINLPSQPFLGHHLGFPPCSYFKGAAP